MARPRVLIVEDNPTHQKLAELICDKHGVAATVLTRPEEAVRALGSDLNYSAVFVDLGVPKSQTGVRFLQQLNRMRLNRQVNIPIVAVTAHAMDDDRDKCFYLGADDYLSKPYTVDQFGAMLDRWIFPDEQTQRLAS